MERLFQIFTETSERFFFEEFSQREKEGIPTPNAKHLRTIIPAVFIFVYAHEFEERIENAVNID